MLQLSLFERIVSVFWQIIISVSPPVLCLLNLFLEMPLKCSWTHRETFLFCFGYVCPRSAPRWLLSSNPTRNASPDNTYPELMDDDPLSLLSCTLFTLPFLLLLPFGESCCSLSHSLMPSRLLLPNCSLFLTQPLSPFAPLLILPLGYSSSTHFLPFLPAQKTRMATRPDKMADGSQYKVPGASNVC